MAELWDRGRIRLVDALPRQVLGVLLSEVHSRYGEIDPLLVEHGVAGAVEILSRLGLRFVAAAASFPLHDLPSGGALRGALTRAVMDSIEERLGTDPVFVPELCWVRRQPPPSLRPAHQFPHSWHQDGAYGHDFATEGAEVGLVPLVTAWIPLTPCGLRAPGLQLVDRHIQDLCPTDVLGDPFPESARSQPVLAPGDVLLMDGGVVHRTHVAPEMTETRISIELRFVAAGCSRIGRLLARPEVQKS